MNVVWKTTYTQRRFVYLLQTKLASETCASLFHIEGYTLIYRGKICSSYAGLAKYLSNNDTK